MTEPLSGQLPTTLSGFAELAARRLTPGALDYYAGGAGDELTMRDNDASWQRIALRPRVLVDVSVVDPAIVLLGRHAPHPLVVVPMAYQTHADSDGEIAVARAAAATAATYCLSTFAHTGMADLAAAVPGGPRWFQLYVLRDRAETADMIARAAHHGYEAIVITVDRPVLGTRGREARTRFDFATPPERARRGGPVLPNRDVSTVDSTLTWADVEKLAASSPLPILLKGVMSPDDGSRAVALGVAGVIVSNHGGRQLDTVLSGADALAPVVDAIGGAIDVLVDGGIRRGTDIVKALALGATAVLVGRPVLWGLAAGGEAGARAVLEILLTEFCTALALVGVPVAADLERSSIQPAPWLVT